MTKFLTSTILKGTLGQNFIPVFVTYVCYLYGEIVLYKILWHFDQFSRRYKVKKKWINVMDVIPVNVRNISPIFKEKKLSTKFYGVLFEWLNFVDVSDNIHIDNHTLYANCGLHVNFWNFRSIFSFMTRRDHFKLKLLTSSISAAPFSVRPGIPSSAILI